MTESGTLGCAEDYRVIITDRCGTGTVCDLTGEVSGLSYNRVMDDTSQADVTLTMKGSAKNTCCECVGNVTSYLHNMQILRDDESVWGPGPVTNPVFGPNAIRITARDVSAWLDARVIHEVHRFKNAYVLDIVKELLEDALGPDDPCNLLEQVIYLLPPSGPQTRISKDYEPHHQYVGDAIRELASTVLDFTVVGMSMIFAERLEFGPFATLTENDFLVDVEAEERGLEAATKWYVTGTGTTVGTAGGIDPVLGLIERLVNENEVTDKRQLTKGAVGRLQASYPPPVYINVPDGAQLASTAPVTIEQLIPGSEFGVLLRNVCRPVLVQHRLTALSVTVDGKDEKVGVTLLPVGINVGEGNG